MALLDAFLRTSRARRRASPLSFGLPGDGEVLLDAADDRLGPVLVAAARGEYRPAAGLLTGTREGAEWERRDRYVTRLAHFARFRAEWLQHWCATAPHDPGALLVRARLAVDRCWESPAPGELLHRVRPLVGAAVERGGPDPVPWRVALDHARGTDAPHAEFETLWEQAVRRAPHHYGCHVAALDYLAAASPGAHRECLDFAETAAQDAPLDSLVQALPLRAAFTCLTEGDPAGVGRDRLDAAADRAVALSAVSGPADPWTAGFRNLLAYVLVRLDRYRDALEEFRLTGPYATSFPWDRDTDDPLGRFLQVRGDVRAAVAATLPATGFGPPHGERGGRVGPAEH
ncbi:hypothetical protein [Streptomyces sp. DH24]|uniref:hypothetical protein n=1 Tax=Streptomyces sp. DH24 TaxID=3040123 RepID=UPI0024428228|nr:hypothetical protein [Streptomyces sp. DH24]MDG9715311.1 hypothetical protein [Streptomyces sp. DH24]